MSTTPDHTEVEGRFLIKDGIESKVETLGGHLIKHVTFTDRYYDTHVWELTLSDYWVRQRDQTWQLKYPPVGGRRGENAPCEQYAECEDEASICRLLKPVVPKKGLSEDRDVTKLMTELECENYATFTTERKSYRICDLGINVDLDMADFGYQVGEIEILTDKRRDIDQALEVINEFAQKLGWYSSWDPFANEEEGGKKLDVNMDA